MLVQQAISVLVRTTPPRTLRITKVDVGIGLHCEALVIGEFMAATPCQRLVEFVGQFFDCRINAMTTVLVCWLTIFTNIANYECGTTRIAMKLLQGSA
jgi:hypothetical protein